MHGENSLRELFRERERERGISHSRDCGVGVGGYQERFVLSPSKSRLVSSFSISIVKSSPLSPVDVGNFTEPRKSDCLRLFVVSYGYSSFFIAPNLRRNFGDRLLGRIQGLTSQDSNGKA